MGSRIAISPLFTDRGLKYGAEARDMDSGERLAMGKQIAMQEDQTLVVEVTQFFESAEVYKGKQFFLYGELVKEQKISGDKKWNVFQSWSW